MNVSRLVDAMREAIQAERLAVQRALGTLGSVGKVRISRGRRLHADPGAQVYRLELDVDYTIPEGTRVQLHVPGDIGTGETLRHDRLADCIDCVFREDLTDEITSGMLEFDSTFLLNRLEERLLAIAGGPPGAPLPAPAEPFHRKTGLDFLTGEAARGEPVNALFPDLSRSQETAVRFVLGQRIGYLWGPPGTGKTQTVARLVHALLERSEKVLLTAHTNIATDNALLRVLQARKLPRDSVIRVGYHAASLDEYGVGLDAAVDRALQSSHLDLVEEIAGLCRVVSALQPRHRRTLMAQGASLTRRLRIAAGVVAAHGEAAEVDLPAHIAHVGKRIEVLEQAILDAAALVATTLTRCYASRLFRDFRTDTVLIDEASTASLATSFVAACTARRRAIAIGDFRQLPAIVQAREPAALRWLGRHVFESSGADDVARDHPLRAMLHEQWRMHPDISGVVSRVFYGGRLTDAPAVLERADPGPAVALFDTTRMEPRSESTLTGSKVNHVHAGLIAELVIRSRAHRRSIAVIAPYRAQVRAIREAVRVRAPELLQTDELEIFTVHRFQGRDKDVVLFDLTEAPGTRCIFLDDLRSAHAPNLINVAMSRARERLVVIGAFDHLRSGLGSSSTVLRVLKSARIAGALELEAGHEADRGKIETFLGIADRG